MNTVHLSDLELDVARQAVRLYLRTFGHDEHDVVAAARSALAKLDAASAEDDETVAS